MIEKLFREEVKDIRPYVQGKPAEEVQREYGLERIEKLASNENQFGPSPKAVEAMQCELTNCNFYPESIPDELLDKLSAHLGVPKENVALGGSGESLIRLINLAFIEKGDDIIVCDPTFSIYENQAGLLGGTTTKVSFKEDDSFDIDGILNAITDKTKLIWLCSPNNPTGNIASQEQIDYLISKLPDHVALILDEAYYEFACGFDDYPKDNSDLVHGNNKKDNVIVLRTFSKIYGIAGLRIGYIMAAKPVVDKINALKLTFEINRLAQVAAYAALDDKDYLNMVVTENRNALEYLANYFEEKGWHYYPSYANFIWVDVQTDSGKLFEDLQKKGVIIRPGFLWGWKNWIRVSTGTKEQMEFFVEVMNDILG